jgi:hypothetical protein
MSRQFKETLNKHPIQENGLLQLEPKNQTVQSVALVKAIAPSSRVAGDVVYVTDLTAHFVFDLSSTASGNDTTVIAPTSGSGRWLISSDTSLPIVAGDITDVTVANHITDSEGAHAASAISILDSGNKYTATEVEAALAEVKTLADAAATASALTAHLDDTTDAHDASAISVLDSGNKITATTVEGAVVEIATNVENHLGDTSDAHDASAISVLDSGNKFTATEVEAALAEVKTLADAAATSTALTNHIDDTSSAHMGSTIGIADANNYFTGTDLAAVLDELHLRIDALEYPS